MGSLSTFHILSSSSRSCSALTTVCAKPAILTHKDALARSICVNSHTWLEGPEQRCRCRLAHLHAQVLIVLPSRTYRAGTHTTLPWRAAEAAQGVSLSTFLPRVLSSAGGPVCWALLGPVWRRRQCRALLVQKSHAGCQLRICRVGVRQPKHHHCPARQQSLAQASSSACGVSWTYARATLAASSSSRMSGLSIPDAAAQLSFRASAAQPSSSTHVYWSCPVKDISAHRHSGLGMQACSTPRS